MFASKLKLDSSVTKLTGRFAIAMGLIMFAWGGRKYFRFRAAANLTPRDGESGGSDTARSGHSSRRPWWLALLLMLAWIGLLEGSMTLGEQFDVSALLVGFAVVLVFEIAIVSWAGQGDNKPTSAP